MYFFGIMAISIAFFDQLKCWMAEMMINSDQDTLHYEYVVCLRKMSQRRQLEQRRLMERQEAEQMSRNANEREISLEAIERDQQ